MKKKSKLSSSAVRQHRYRVNLKAGLEYFGFYADRDLLQYVLIQGDRPGSRRGSQSFDAAGRHPPTESNF